MFFYERQAAGSTAAILHTNTKILQTLIHKQTQKIQTYIHTYITYSTTGCIVF